jgi:hypothetical protein
LGDFSLFSTLVEFHVSQKLDSVIFLGEAVSLKRSFGAGEISPVDSAADTDEIESRWMISFIKMRGEAERFCFMMQLNSRNEESTGLPEHSNISIAVMTSFTSDVGGDISRALFGGESTEKLEIGLLHELARTVVSTAVLGERDAVGVLDGTTLVFFVDRDCFEFGLDASTGVEAGAAGFFPFLEAIRERCEATAFAERGNDFNTFDFLEPLIWVPVILISIAPRGERKALAAGFGLELGDRSLMV